MKFDGRIDVWAIGVILYGMLVGELPFKGSLNYEIKENIRKGNYKIPPEIRKALSILNDEAQFHAAQGVLEFGAALNDSQGTVAKVLTVRKNIRGKGDRVKRRPLSLGRPESGQQQPKGGWSKNGPKSHFCIKNDLHSVK